ncbi:3-oxoacyl-[acyl-carrier-protein] synthase II [Thermoflexales bacterium]|nr:3-oxoacyl-[acyl-carrier-protein] synthase II [Thermoflexales bacterium]
MEQRPDSQRVVVTGLGALSPLGLSVNELWEGLVAGRSGVAPITHFDPEDMPTRIAGEVKGFDPTKWINFKEARRMGRATQMAVVAAHEVLADAGFGSVLPEDVQEEAGVYIGTAYGPFDKADEEMQNFAKKGWRGVSPFALSSPLASMPAFHVSLMTQAKGPIGTPINACAAGTQAIVEASEYIRRGHAQVMICGGVEGSVHRYSVAGFCAMRALSTRNDEPERASRPFDKLRDGFILSEGAGLVVLESLEHALARKARIYAEVLGGASSADAYHVAAPDPKGAGAVRAMKRALRDAGVDIMAVSYINAHGTSTPINDFTETMAIKTVFGEQAYNVPISSTKSMLGHAMGGAGALEAIACVKTIETGTIHATINYENPDPECDLDYVPNTSRQADVRVVLSNSFGLGGNNACLVLAKYLNGRH